MKWKNEKYKEIELIEQTDLLINDSVILNIEAFVNSQVLDINQNQEQNMLLRYKIYNDLLKEGYSVANNVEKEAAEKIKKNYEENKNKNISELIELINATEMKKHIEREDTKK